MEINLDAQSAEYEGKTISLTGKEYQIVELLARRKGSTITNDAMLNHLDGGMDEPDMKIIDVFVCKLRKKISHATNGQSYIDTVWGRGYVMREPDKKGNAGKAA